MGSSKVMDGLAAPPATLETSTGGGAMSASFDERKVRIDAVDASMRTMPRSASQILRMMKPTEQEVLPQHWFAR